MPNPQDYGGVDARDLEGYAVGYRAALNAAIREVAELWENDVSLATKWPDAYGNGSQSAKAVVDEAFRRISVSLQSLLEEGPHE